MNIKKIDPAIREYVKKINSYSGAKTTSSCQGHVRKVNRGTIWLEGELIDLQPAILFMPPYMFLKFTGNRKFWAFLQKVVFEKMWAIIFSKNHCGITLHSSVHEEVFEYNPNKLKQLKKRIKAERKQVFETVIKALKNVC